MHVRGYKEEGTTTTPFDMVMLNDLDRYHLVMDVIDRVAGLGARAAGLRQEMVDARLRARRWTREHGEDIPEVTEWALDRVTLRLLTVNAGSTSMKLSLVDAGEAVDSLRVARRGGRPRSPGWTPSSTVWSTAATGPRRSSSTTRWWPSSRA